MKKGIKKCSLVPLVLLLLALPLGGLNAIASDDERDQFNTDDDTPPMLELLRSKPSSKIFVGKIEKLKGTSWVRRAANKGKDKPAYGLRIFENDFLVTEQGRLRFYTKTGVVFELGAKTSLSIEKLRVLTEVPITRVRFLNGLVHISFNGEMAAQPEKAPLITPKKHRFLIKTMNAVIEVPEKADFYLFQPENEKDLTIRMVQGKIQVISVVTNQKTELGEKTGAVLRTSGLISEPIPLKEEVLQAYMAKTKQ